MRGGWGGEDGEEREGRGIGEMREGEGMWGEEGGKVRLSSGVR